MSDEHDAPAATVAPRPGPPSAPRPGPPSAPVPSTSSLDDALARLDDLDAAPTSTHVAALEAVHDALVAELARTED